MKNKVDKKTESEMEPQGPLTGISRAQGLDLVENQMEAGG